MLSELSTFLTFWLLLQFGAKWLTRVFISWCSFSFKNNADNILHLLFSSIRSHSISILLNDNSEFNSKPELEIYADDVKCSHGSTSGSIDEDSIYYLMTRGLNRKESVRLLVDGFLSEVAEMIKSNSVKKFVQSKLKEQIYENNLHFFHFEYICFCI